MPKILWKKSQVVIQTHKKDDHLKNNNKTMLKEHKPQQSELEGCVGADRNIYTVCTCYMRVGNDTKYQRSIQHKIYI